MNFKVVDVAEVAETIPLLSDLSADVQQTILRVLVVVVVIALVYLLRKVVVRILMSPVRRMINRSDTQTDNMVLDAIERPLQLVVIAFAVGLTVTILDFGPDVKVFGENLSRALLVAAVTFIIYNLIGTFTVNSDVLARATGIKVPDRLIPFLTTVLKVFVLVIGGFIILETFSYDVTGLLASFGVIGLAFSLAAQDTASNIFGFTAIVSDNPFHVGDYIVLGDTAGTVEKVGMRSTHIRKLDQSLVIVPNSNFTSAAVTNWSRLSKRRLDFYLGLVYETTADQIENVTERIREMIKARENVDPESVVVRFVNFNDSSLDLRIIAYILLADWGEYTAEVEQINLEVMRIVEELGLGIAFPSRSLYIESMPNIRHSVNKDQPENDVKPVPMSPPTPRTVETSSSDKLRTDDMPDQANESASNDADEGQER